MAVQTDAAGIHDAPLPKGLRFAEHSCWTCIAADHEAEDGSTVIDADRIGERTEEFRGYFMNRGDAEAFRAEVADAWDEADDVGSCASLRFGNCFVVRLRRVVVDWFAPTQWDATQPDRGWHSREL